MAKTMSSKNDSAYTISGGTASSTSIWSNSGTSMSFGGGFPTFNDIYSRKNSSKPKIIKVRDLPKRDFWDGVEWKEFTSYVPRKSITGKWIVGKMHKRWRTPPMKHRGVGLGNFKQFAKTKELFAEKLRGKA